MSVKGNSVDVAGMGKASRMKASSTSTLETSLPVSPLELPKAITPIDIFLRCIKRAENLIAFHQDEKDPNEEHYCDAYRASVVLTIAALDAYARTVVILKIKEKLNKRFKQNDPAYEYIKSIMSYETLLTCALNDSFTQEIETQIADDFQKKSFQGERKITHYMKLAGYSNVIGVVAKKMNTNEDNLKQAIDKFTNRRHTIAHGGDYDISKIPYTENKIDKEYALDCVKTVKIFTQSLDTICFKK